MSKEEGLKPIHVDDDLYQMIEGRSLICLVDGEHYPPVTKWTIKELRDMGADVEALIFLGGTEKVENAVEELGGEGDYEVIAPKGKRIPLKEISETVERISPDIVLDLSDEPILDYEKRFSIGSVVLSKGSKYMGSDFVFTPPSTEKILKKPNIGIIGTGKRVGKTAVGVTVARLLKKANFDPVVVCMGRGGPPEPNHVDTSKMELNADTLINIAEEGGHAASDYLEDALLGQVPTVGCRRCGGGMAGNPFSSNVLKGASLTNDLPQKFVVMEGSGSTFPPVKTDRKIVIVGAGQPIRNITDYMGEYRLLISDLAIVTMCEEPIADEKKVEKIEEGIKKINPDIDIALTIFRPEPLGDISGKKIFLATTAKGKIVEKISEYLEEEYSCEVTGFSNSLSNRPALRKDLKENLKEADTLLTEIKAASIDVAAITAKKNDAEVVFMHNRPLLVGGNIESLEGSMIEICEKAKEGR